MRRNMRRNVRRNVRRSLSHRPSVRQRRRTPTLVLAPELDVDSWYDTAVTRSGITVGTWVTFIDGRAQGLRIRRCRLEVIAGADAGLSRVFESPVIRIGGQRINDLALSDRKISGSHCEIQLGDRGYRLRDLDSTNGTFVNGLRIADVWIGPGTLIYVGDSQIRFQPLADSVEHTLSERDRFGSWVGRSAVARELFARLERIAATDATVLVTGETGTGKDLISEAIHENSARAKGPFVVFDCSAIAANLVESELFGHERGAFTGAHAQHVGAFERAHQGTLFLDEIGELSPDLQPKLLRAIERKQFRRVGGTATLRSDVRIVAATNRDLGLEVGRGQFREDLYYRLAVAQVHLPPLRRRKEDIPVLVEHLLANIPGGDQVNLRQRTIDLMRKHDWPGNVRELRNMVERAVHLSEVPETLTQLHRGRPRFESGNDANAAAMPAPGTAETPAETASPAAAPRIAPTTAPTSSGVDVDIDVPFKAAKRAMVDEFERAYVSQLLERHGGNVSAAARAAGLDRMSIYRIMQRRDLSGHKP